MRLLSYVSKKVVVNCKRDCTRQTIFECENADNVSPVQRGFRDRNAGQDPGTQKKKGHHQKFCPLRPI